MLSDDCEVGIVFNGCIYNFRDLRKDLERRGHRFRSDGDTEVLLNGYREWGIDELVGRLRGMFAFGIWDNPRRTLTLARDRLGVKPLAYCAQNGELAFASTVGALRAAGFGGAIDPQAVLEYLEYGFVTDARAVFQSIEKLPPATVAEWRDGRVECRQYWARPETDHFTRVTFEDAVEETERLLVQATRLRLVSDVPIGVLLSGGIDSSLVCWALRSLNANVKAFTVRAPRDPSDESEQAAKTAQQLGISHDIVEMPGAEFSLDGLLDAYSEPFSCESAQAMMWVSKEVKRVATVLLTGDGGDDVFLGYPFFRDAWRAQQVAQALPRVAADIWTRLRRVAPARLCPKRLGNFLDYATGGLGNFARAHDGLPYFTQRAMLGENLAGRQLPQRCLAASYDSACRLLTDVSESHRKLHFTSEFMPKVDGATMYYGIEARAPLLDHTIFEFAAALPPQVLLHRGALKAVLREIARRRLNSELAARPKQGFTVPIERWLTERWGGMLTTLQDRSVLVKDGWICPGSIEPALREAAVRRTGIRQLWRLLVLQHWFEKNARPRPAA